MAENIEQQMLADALATYARGDYSEAFKQLDTAVRYGAIDAAYTIGLCYKYGHGTAPKLSSMVINFTAAAIYSNHPEAMVEIGEYLENHPEVATIEKLTALEWYHKAAKLGSANAHFALGRYYSNLERSDTAQDLALSFYAKAAHLGHPEARAAIRNIVVNGY